MKLTYLITVAASFLLLFACEAPGEASTSEEPIPSQEVSPEVDGRTTTVKDNIDDVTEPIPPAPDLDPDPDEEEGSEILE